MPVRAEEVDEQPRTTRAAATRQRVIETARNCIAELGPLGASSNEIARRAGVSWGVIQYHFGTRTGILLAVIEDGFDDLLDVLDRYDPTTSPCASDRIEDVADAIWSYCAQPDYMLYMDVLRLLTHDPDSRSAVGETLARTEQQLSSRINRLLRDIVEGEAAITTIRSLIFATMRGLALKQSFTRASTEEPDADAFAATERSLFVRALSLAVADSGRGGPQ
ncbi:MAG: TetR/AcrR family transcriptional regulator [Acidimicrobiales bacterium]|nr:TetR/AcrR family transcriptional regulator [Acidimicrobiales bacterium]